MAILRLRFNWWYIIHALFHIFWQFLTCIKKYGLVIYRYETYVFVSVMCTCICTCVHVWVCTITNHLSKSWCMYIFTCHWYYVNKSYLVPPFPPPLPDTVMLNIIFINPGLQGGYNLIWHEILPCGTYQMLTNQVSICTVYYLLW